MLLAKDIKFENFYATAFKKYYDIIRSKMENDNHNETIKECVKNDFSQAFKYNGSLQSNNYFANFMDNVVAKHDREIFESVLSDSLKFERLNYVSSKYRMNKQIYDDTLVLDAVTNNNVSLLRNLLDSTSTIVNFSKIYYFKNYECIKMLLEADVTAKLDFEQIVRSVLRDNNDECFDLVFDNHKKYPKTNLFDMFGYGIFEGNLSTINLKTMTYLETRFPDIFQIEKSGLSLYELMLKNCNNSAGIDRNLVLYLTTKLYPEQNINSLSKIYKLLMRIDYKDAQIKKFFKNMFVNFGIKLEAHPHDDFEFDESDLMKVLGVSRKNHSASTIKKVLSEVKINNLSYYVYQLLSHYFDEKLEDVKDGILKIVRCVIEKCDINEHFKRACRNDNVNVANFIVKYCADNDSGTCVSHSDSNGIIYEYEYFDSEKKKRVSVNKFIDFFFTA